ncbi:MAG: hypothetical protein NE334_08985 [Lentisphaeraceae bacterium]|nr:hypothetical protein [Lentisphaeraceae bacterium]
MENIKIIDVDKVPISSVIRLISEKNDLNIVPSIKAKQTSVGIYLKNINPIVALEEICSSHNLWLQKDPSKNIYRIYSLDEYKKSVLKFSEEIKVYDLKYPNSKTISKAIFELFPSRVIYFESNNQRLDEDVEELENKLEKLLIFEEQVNNNQNNNGQNNNQRNNNFNNRNNNGQNNGQNNENPRDVTMPKQASHEKINLTADVIQRINTAESIEEIKRIISSQDLLKNSRIYISSILEKNQMIIRTSDQEALEKIDTLIKKLDKPNPMVLLEMKILAVTLDDNFESAFDLIYNDGTSSATLNPGLIQTNGALTYSYINSNFNVAMTLLEEESKVRTLATPVILTLNREVSKFFNGNQGVPVLTGFQGQSERVINPISGVEVFTLPTPEYDNRDLGTTLKVSPTINSDKTVQLQISSIESELDQGSVDVLIPAGDTFVVAAVDTEKRRSFTGTVLATDGKMIAVGGIIKESMTEVEAGVPILRDIPLLDYFFADKKKVKLREEIILLIKPYVIYNEQDHKTLSEDLLKRVSEHPNAGEQKDKLIKKEEIK